MRIAHYLLLTQRLLLLLLVYFLCRVAFFASNYPVFSQASTQETLFAFAYGVRYDLSTIFSINVVFVLLSVLPFSWVAREGYQKGLRAFFLLSNLPFIALNLTDIEFFKFTGRRTSFEIIRIAGDVADQLPQLLLNYWHISALTLLLAGLMAWFYPLRSARLSTIRLPFAWIILPLWIGMSILMIRNSFELKPLLARNAFILTPYVMGNVALNTPFVFFKTADAKPLQRISFFDKKQDYLSLITSKSTPVQKFAKVSWPVGKKSTMPSQPQNVVIIILESFSSEYMGKGNPYRGYTPFLDSLAGKGLFFKNHFANGKRSIEALPAVMASIPGLMDDAFISSPFQTNRVYGLGTALRDKGYHTSFFHGGKNGTMGFDYFAKAAGFSHYYGMNEYPGSKDFDGNWGIFDEPFLQFFAERLSAQPQPFASAVFTLSSHQPYTIPDKYKDHFPKGTLEIHESIGYADMALRNFFAAARRTDWYKNTLFIITADHTQMLEQAAYQHEAGAYDVPLIFFHPQGYIPQADTQKVTQHADLMPTILEYTGTGAEQRMLFGRSVFGSEEGVAVNYNNGHYLLIHRDYYLTFSPDKGSTLFRFDTGQLLTVLSETEQQLLVEYERELKAYIQYYNNGLIDNNWYDQSNLNGQSLGQEHGH